jgi:peptidoglycan/LPS O-acetylase OafA/YrhL
MVNARHNSYDLLRLILAFFVLISHAYWLKGIENPDIYTITNSQTYLAEIGLIGFFALSGFLISKSFLRRKDIIQYSINRVLRIFPGFWVCLFLTAFFFAPIIFYLEKGNLNNFPLFGNWSATNYLRLNYTTVINQVNLKGVLDSVSRKNLNGSIWTLHVELMCYLLTVCLGYLGLLRRKKLLLIFILISFTLYLSILFDFDYVESLKYYIPFKKAKLFMAYLFGSLIVVFEKQILNQKFMIISGVFVILILLLPPLFKMFFPLVFTVFFLSSFSLFQINLKYDISYGFYVYAWPIQQLILVFYSPEINLFSFICLTLLLLIPISVLSFLYIEKPIISQKNKVHFVLLSTRRKLNIYIKR